MPRPQFTIRALLVLLLAIACFFGGIRFEREWQRRADEKAALASKAVRQMLQGRRTVIKKGPFEFIVNTDEERRGALEFLKSFEKPTHQQRQSSTLLSK
ncbi:MAG TPA: hypothetical protein VG826_19665 [Pirellulales bacterium]|nr:hypothetical protein [Pirellulales bacterium]